MHTYIYLMMLYILYLARQGLFEPHHTRKILRRFEPSLDMICAATIYTRPGKKLICSNLHTTYEATL